MDKRAPRAAYRTVRLSLCVVVAFGLARPAFAGECDGDVVPAWCGNPEVPPECRGDVVPARCEEFLRGPGLRGAKRVQLDTCSSGSNPFSGAPADVSYLKPEQHYEQYLDFRYGSRTFRFAEALPSRVLAIVGAALAAGGVITLAAVNLGAGRDFFAVPSSDIGPSLVGIVLSGVGSILGLTGGAITLATLNYNWRLPEWNKPQDTAR